jgi:hypothetical protein
VNVDWYDRDSYQTITYNGDTYIGYVFVTVINPDSVTNQSFAYSVPENPYVILNPYSDKAKAQGAFFIKQVILTQAQIDGERTTKKVDITVKATDGGREPTDTVRLIVDYSKQPATSASFSL